MKITLKKTNKAYKNKSLYIKTLKSKHPLQVNGMLKINKIVGRYIKQKHISMLITYRTRYR